jgi:hypothetical protein
LLDIGAQPGVQTVARRHVDRHAKLLLKEKFDPPPARPMRIYPPGSFRFAIASRLFIVRPIYEISGMSADRNWQGRVSAVVRLPDVKIAGMEVSWTIVRKHHDALGES